MRVNGRPRTSAGTGHEGVAAWLGPSPRRPLSARLRGSNQLRLGYWRAQRTLRFDRRSLHALPPDAVLVMMFHRIGPDENRFWPGLHPETFASVLRSLRPEVDFVNTEQLGRRDRPDRPAAIVTIDDGYRDGLEYGAPILREVGIPAVYNVVPVAIASGRPPNPLAELLQGADRDVVARLRIAGFDGSLPEAPTPAHFYSALSAFVEGASPGNRVNLLDAIATAIGGEKPAPGNLMLTAADVAVLARDFEIGCNGYDHRSMAGRPAEDLVRDIELSRTFFRDRLGLGLSTYAFPRGGYEPDMVEAARQSGITTLLLGSGGIAQESDYPLTRVPVWGNSFDEALCRAIGLNGL